MSVFAEFTAPATAYPLGRLLLAAPAATIDVDTVVPTGGTTSYVWVSDHDAESLLADLQAIESIDAPEVVDRLPGRTLVRFEWTGQDAPLFDLFQDTDGRVVAASGSDGGWTFRVRFPDQVALRAFVDAARDHGIEIALLEQLDPDTPFADDGIGLSPKQLETLRAAYEAGYFAVPREVTLRELAAQMGISEQGVSERLRRGLSAYLEAILAGDAATDGKSTGWSGEA